MQFPISHEFTIDRTPREFARWLNQQAEATALDFLARQMSLEEFTNSMPFPQVRTGPDGTPRQINIGEAIERREEDIEVTAEDGRRKTISQTSEHTAGAINFVLSQRADCDTRVTAMCRLESYLPIYREILTDCGVSIDEDRENAEEDPAATPFGADNSAGDESQQRTAATTQQESSAITVGSTEEDAIVDKPKETYPGKSWDVFNIRLTPKQRKVAELTAKGKKPKEIAKQFDPEISTKTVSRHKEGIRQELKKYLGKAPSKKYWLESTLVELGCGR